MSSLITDEMRTAAREAARERWLTGSSDTTQMFLSVNAALEAIEPMLEKLIAERENAAAHEAQGAARAARDWYMGPGRL